jgi:hypothetical protein
MAQIAEFDILRVLGHAAIGAAYVKIGTPARKPIHILKVTNTTDADMIITDDGVTDKDIIPMGSFVLYDISANRDNFNPADVLVLLQGTQYSIKQVAAPSKGSVYITMIYGS